jgi:hypothetical protein
MAKKKRKDEGGMLIRGADGRLYFISKTELKQYALSPKQHRAVAKAPRKHVAKTLKDTLNDLARLASDSASVFRVSVRGGR